MKNYLWVLIVCTSALYGKVEQSVVLEIEALYEQIESKKYSLRQLEIIKKTLFKKEEKIRVATFNTLFDFYDENLAELYRWPLRKERVIEVIHHLQPDVLGVQEVYAHLLKDLLKGLGDVYSFFGEPKGGGEINGIFYNSKRFILLDSCFQNPLNLVKLQERKTGKVFAFCNTHLAFSNIEKREAQAKKIYQLVSNLLLEVPSLILTGDMNTFPNLPSLKKLPFYDGNRIESLLKGELLLDARECALLGHLGPLSTFSNTEEGIEPFKGKGTPGVFLDHIYVSKDVTVLLHATESGLVDGLFPSDHFPLFADVVLN